PTTPPSTRRTPRASSRSRRCRCCPRWRSSWPRSDASSAACRGPSRAEWALSRVHVRARTTEIRSRPCGELTRSWNRSRLTSALGKHPLRDVSPRLRAGAPAFLGCVSELSMRRATAAALGGSLRTMTVNIYYDGDCPETVGERVAILGYGSQGHAHAQNLK